MLDYLERAARHFRTAAIVFVFSLAALAVIVLMQDKQYEARTLILFTLGREYVYVPDSRQADIKAPNPGDFEGVVNAEMLLLNNPEVSSAALQAVGLGRAYPDLPQNDDGYLQAMLQFDAATTIELVTGSYVVKVAVRHKDPVIAADLANALAAAFLERRRMMYAGIESASLRARLTVAHAQADEVTKRTAELLGGADPMVVEAELTNVMGEQLHLSALLRDANASRAALVERQSALGDQLGMGGERLTTEISMQEEDARIRYLEGALEEVGREIDRLSALMPRLRVLKESQQSHAERIADLEMRLQDSEALAMAPQDENVRVIEAAVPQLRPVSMPKNVQLIVAGVVAGMLAFGTLMFALLLDRRIVTARGAAAELGVRALGELPVPSNRRQRPAAAG